MSHANKTSIEILKTEENFTGFDVHDVLLSSIKTKQNGIINILSREKDYDAKDWQAIKDNAKSNNLPFKDDDVEPNTSSNEIRIVDHKYDKIIDMFYHHLGAVIVDASEPEQLRVEPIRNRDTELNGAFREYSNLNIEMQSFDVMIKSIGHVFKYLKTHELLSASQVCTAWNIIAMDRFLWRTVRLKNVMVCNWDKCIDTLHGQGSVSLDMRHMLIPIKNEDLDKFWLEFTIALKKAQQLKSINLYKCPASIVEDTIYSLPQLSVLNAMSIKNPNISKETYNPNKLMTLNLLHLDQMTNLTEIRIKGLTGIKLTHLPSFESLVNLKSLSLTSIIAFPRNTCRTLNTLSTSLEFFEIGDCDCLSEDFAGVLTRLNNLTSLRLENCFGSFEKVAKKVLSSIRGLDKLKILELINIEFSNIVEGELEKLTNIKALLIIPTYIRQCAATISHLIDCLKKLKKTLTHLVWGITHEFLRLIDIFITKYQTNDRNIGNNLESFDTEDAENSIPIIRTRKLRHLSEEESVTNNDIDIDETSDIVDIISVPAFAKLVETLMINCKSKVVKIPFTTTTQVYLLEHFNNL